MIRRRAALAAGPLLLALAVGAAGAPRPADDPVRFWQAFRSALFAGGGFSAKFDCLGPRGFRATGTLSVREPLRIRIDSTAGGKPVAYLRNGNGTFLLLGDGDWLFPVPEEALPTTRFGRPPDSATALDRETVDYLRAARATLRRGGQECELVAEERDRKSGFRLVTDRDGLRPVAFQVLENGKPLYRATFSEFKSVAPDAALFNERARRTFDLYR